MKQCEAKHAPLQRNIRYLSQSKVKSNFWSNWVTCILTAIVLNIKYAWLNKQQSHLMFSKTFFHKKQKFLRELTQTVPI